MPTRGEAQLPHKGEVAASHNGTNGLWHKTEKRGLLVLELGRQLPHERDDFLSLIVRRCLVIDCPLQGIGHWPRGSRRTEKWVDDAVGQVEVERGV